MLIGFLTFDEAERAQRICLEAPLKAAKEFLKYLARQEDSGRVRIIRPLHPQPPTLGPTMWTDSPDLHEDIQEWNRNE
jgi:hypothetical protein